MESTRPWVFSFWTAGLRVYYDQNNVEMTHRAKKNWMVIPWRRVHDTILLMINRKVHLKSRCNLFAGFLDFPVTRSCIAMNSFMLPVAFRSHTYMCSWALVRRKRLISSRCRNPLLILHCHVARNPWSKESNWLVKWKMQKEKELDQRLLLEMLCNRMRYVGCYWESDSNVWISVGSALTTRSLLIWQLAFPKRTRCCNWKTKSSTQYSSNIWRSIIVHTWRLRLRWVKRWWP